MARNIIARFIPVFPSNVVGAAGIKVTKIGGLFTIETDFQQFSNEKGSILKSNGDGTWQALLRGQNGQVLQSTTDDIVWSTQASSQTFVGVQPIVVNTVGSTTTTSWNGDFFSPNQGAIIKRGATDYEGLDVGAPDQVLTVNSGGTDIEWKTPTGGGGGNLSPYWAGAATGTADALILTPTPAITAYADGQVIDFIASANNTGPATAAISGLAAQTISIDGNALQANDIVLGLPYRLTQVNSQFYLNKLSTKQTFFNLQVFTASGTYTPSAEMRTCEVYVLGGGGGGGGSTGGGAGTGGGGGGGGAGGMALRRLTAADVGSSQTVTIGAAGAGSNGLAGTNGGTTSFGALVSATGGEGGALGSGVSGASVRDGGDGGNGSNGNLNGTGQPGGASYNFSSSAFTGYGGSSPWGGGGRQIGAGSGAVGGISATGRGSGGGGAYSVGTGSDRGGGNGTAGLCIVKEYG